MKSSAAISLMIIATVLVFGIGAIIQYQVWTECRQDHSFFYCLNLIRGR